MPAVEVCELVVRFGDTTAVDGVSFAAEPGQILALLGPNGAGKTTTVETIEGYRPPSSGSVRVMGLDPVADRRSVAPLIGVMLQAGGVYPGMGARAALRLFASYYDQADDPERLLALVGLDSVATTPWRRLSGGEQQRLSLALALIGRPRVAFLDEPSAGMDPAARRVLWAAIASMRDAGACVVLTTHYMEEAERLADRVVIIDRGRVVSDGSPADLMASGSAGELRFGAPTGIDLEALGLHLDAPVVEERPGEYRVAAAATPERVASLTAWLAAQNIPLADLRAGRQTLEDVFLRLTGQTSQAEAERAPDRRARRRR